VHKEALRLAVISGAANEQLGSRCWGSARTAPHHEKFIAKYTLPLPCSVTPSPARWASGLWELGLKKSWPGIPWA